MAALHMFDCLDHRTSSGSRERWNCIFLFPQTKSAFIHQYLIIVNSLMVTKVGITFSAQCACIRFSRYIVPPWIWWGNPARKTFPGLARFPPPICSPIFGQQPWCHFHTCLTVCTKRFTPRQQISNKKFAIFSQKHCIVEEKARCFTWCFRF